MNQHKETSEGSGIAAQVAVYTASVAAGLLSMWASIRDTFYRGLIKTKWLKEIKTKRDKAYDDIGGFTGEEYTKAHKKVHADYTKTITEKLDEKGFTNSWKKFKFLTVNEKVKVVGIAVTVAATAVGAITMLRQNRKIERQLEEMNRKNNPDTSPSIN